MVKAINGCRKLITLNLNWIPFRSTDEIVHVFKTNKQIKELKVPIVELESSNLSFDRDNLTNDLQMIRIESLCLKTSVFYDRRHFLQLMNRMPKILLNVKAQ